MCAVTTYAIFVLVFGHKALLKPSLALSIIIVPVLIMSDISSSGEKQKKRGIEFHWSLSYIASFILVKAKLTSKLGVPKQKKKYIFF